MTAYESAVNKGFQEGLQLGIAKRIAERNKRAVIKLLLRGVYSISDIADAIEVPLSYVVEIRDTLLREGNMLAALVREFKIQ